MKNHKIKSIFILCLFFIISNLYFFQKPVYSESNSLKKILIINSYTKGNNISGYNTNNWHDEIITGLESKLKDNKENVSVALEYMDSNLNYSDEYYQILYNLYNYKYSNTEFDAIITLNNNATDFILKFGNDLFPNTPVIFSNVNQIKKALLNNQPFFTGIYKNEDFKSTFDIALALHPNTKHFFVILNNNSQVLNQKKIFEQLIPSYENKVDFMFFYNTNINVVKEKIDTLSYDTVIFIAGGFNNDKGEAIPITEAGNILLKNCRLPVYSTSYSYLNNGIIGGMITSGKKLGESLGTITSRILNGEKPSDIPAIVDNSHNYILDYKQLNRFKINMSHIPANSEIINDPISTYSISKQVMIYILFIFILILIVTIIFLQTTICKLKNTKKLLLNSESLLKTIINSTPDIICYKNPDGQMLQANNAILNLLNIKENEHKYKTFNQLYDLSAIQRDELITCEYYDNKCWEYGDVYRTEEILTSAKENIRKTYDIIKIPLFHEDKTRRGLITIGRDITEHKANEKNKKIIAELKYYDKLKMEFFTNLSHELRTPLNVIFSAIQVIDKTSKSNNANNIESNKINKYTNIMKQNCYRLTRLMNNFLDISKIDSENFSIELQYIDIINEVEDIVLSIADYVEDKGLSIIFDTEVEEKIIACDTNAIERIMLNLLSNSVKFTPAGGSIKVNIYSRYDQILISVKDTGIGIPLKKQKSIFERFVQVDKSLSRNREGSGIGLSLVKSLVELHKGTITLVSSPNEGSEFILIFPAEALPDTNTSVSDYNLNKNKDEIIKMEFSDIYS